MNRFAAALLSLVILSPSAHADALSQADVLARYRAAVARDPKLPPVRTRRTSGTQQYGGLSGTYVIVATGSKEWGEYKLGIFDEISGTDGKTSWRRDTNGNVRLLSTEEQKDARTDDAVSNHEFAAPQGFAGKVSVRPQTEKRTGCYVVDITPDDGSPTTLFLDPQTFLPRREERMEDDRLSVTTYSDYKRLGGQMRAATRRTREGARKFDEIDTITSVDDNVDAPDTLFTVPAPTKNYTWATPGASNAVLPFNDDDNSIALYCAINGRPAYLDLDSGAGGIAIAKVAADKLALAHQGTLEGRGYGGSVDQYPIHLDTFELIGGVVFQNVTATSLPLFESYAYYEAVPTIGLMGYDLLSRFVVRVDYTAGLLTLTDPDMFVPKPADGVALPLELDDNTPSVLASFDGLPPARFLVDTGDSGTLRLYVPFVQDNKLADKYPKGREVRGEGVGGGTKSRQVRARSFSLAGVTLTNVPCELPLDTKSGSSRKLAGALGHDFLSHFTVTFDYAHQRLFFAPNSDTKKPFDTRTFGVYVVELPDRTDNNKTSMMLFADDKSPALGAGLNAGDTLVKIDGQSAADLGVGEVRRLLSAAGGKDTHVLEIIGRDGGTGKITVRMYDPLPVADHK